MDAWLCLEFLALYLLKPFLDLFRSLPILSSHTPVRLWLHSRQTGPFNSETVYKNVRMLSSFLIGVVRSIAKFTLRSYLRFERHKRIDRLFFPIGTQIVPIIVH